MRPVPRLSDRAWSVATELAKASQSPSSDALDEVGGAVGLLGLPEQAGEQLGDYERGIADAMAAVLESLRQRMMSQAGLELLQRGRHADVLRALGSHPGCYQRELAETLGVRENTLSDSLALLAAHGFIKRAPLSQAPGREAAPPNAKAWSLTLWGKEAIGRLLPVPATETPPDLQVLTQVVEQALAPMAARLGQLTRTVAALSEAIEQSGFREKEARQPFLEPRRSYSDRNFVFKQPSAMHGWPMGYLYFMDAFEESRSTYRSMVPSNTLAPRGLGSGLAQRRDLKPTEIDFRGDQDLDITAVLSYEVAKLAEGER